MLEQLPLIYCVLSVLAMVPRNYGGYIGWFKTGESSVGFNCGWKGLICYNATMSVGRIYSCLLGLQVIAAAGSDGKCHLAIQKGALESVNYNKASLKEEVKKLTGNKGVDVVIDTVGGDIFNQALHRWAKAMIYFFWTAKFDNFLVS